MARNSQELSTYLRSSLAANTRKAYAHDVTLFKRGGGRIPATPQQVARYLAHAAEQFKPSTLARQVAAISHAHEERGLQSPTKSDLVRRTLRGIRRTKGVSQKQAKPVSAELIRKVAAPLDCLSPAQNQRDAALLLVAFAGGFRRSEIAGLSVGDISFSSEGVVIRLRSSKTDQYRRGRDVAIPKAGDGGTCAVKALSCWLRTMGAMTGRESSVEADCPVFCSIDKHGKLKGRLSSASVGWVLRRRIELHGLCSNGFTAHSLRAGLVTSAAKAGVPIWAIQRQTGHRSEATVHRYIRGLSAFECNALERIF